MVPGLPALAQSIDRRDTLVVAVNEDADVLDPTLARSYVSRIVFAGLCDKLFDLDETLHIVPQLALSYRYEAPTMLILTLRPGVLFQDGTVMDAAAVAYSLKRHLTLPGSARRSEISALDHVEIIDNLTVKLVLSVPSAPFVSQLADRAGMIVSPTAAQAEGADFGQAPVCAGPFRFKERVAQDHITLDRFDGYWDAKSIHFARVIYRPIHDSAIKLANLQTGTVDLAERVAATDVASVRADKRLSISVYDGLGYTAFTVNVGHGTAADTPFGRSALVRKAFELSLDRDALIKVVYNGLLTPLAQGMTASNPFYNADLVPPVRDLAKAKALLAQAGVPLPVALSLTMVNTPDQLQLAEIVQAMAAEAGFDVAIQVVEFGAGIAAEDSGSYQVAANSWSGRVDPDGNLYTWLHTGSALNESHYSNRQVDTWLDAARQTSDAAERKALYRKITQQIAQDLPSIYLFNTAVIVGMNKGIDGFRPVPDGLIRLQGLQRVLP
ncbi:ABC transporter substrate-binding protein [Acidisphaera sp. L21]|uniref:ABC transporter substrate-binding protein n=1 Tax=Acidisphaera sp. L21 TaxID=1641851 RepID=UPI00131ABBD6|nr:ABC transporter substrate-binding protein [Acidisphaera sp. L21]